MQNQEEWNLERRECTYRISAEDILLCNALEITVYWLVYDRCGADRHTTIDVVYIAQILNTSRPTVYNAINSLCAKGLFQKAENGENGYKINYHFVENGKQFIQFNAKIMYEILAQCPTNLKSYYVFYLYLVLKQWSFKGCEYGFTPYQLAKKSGINKNTIKPYMDYMANLYAVTTQNNGRLHFAEKTEAAA